MDKELSPLNKGKESGLASREGGSNFLGGKDSISVAGLLGVVQKEVVCHAQN